MSNPDYKVGFLDVIQIDFIVLKCLKLIDWSWPVVFTPLWIAIVMGIVIGVFKGVSGRNKK